MPLPIHASSGRLLFVQSCGDTLEEGQRIGGRAATTYEMERS
jgi:hypothetical protein